MELLHCTMLEGVEVIVCLIAGINKYGSYTIPYFS